MLENIGTAFFNSKFFNKSTATCLSFMDWLQDPIDPMLAKLVNEIPEGDDYIYEVKWDGIRAIITYQKGNITIRTRNKNDVTRQFPELVDSLEAFQVESGVFDGEIICPDSEGRPSFKRIIKRTRTTNEAKIKRLVKTHPVQCYLFDCLFINGEAIVNKPLWHRKDSLAKAVEENQRFRLSQTFEDGYDLFKAVQAQGMEGIIAKDINSRYGIGRRSDSWKKVKVREKMDCKIIGYTQGEGGRTKFFGALHLAEETSDGLVYRGKVGTGFSEKRLEKIFYLLSSLDVIERPSYAPAASDTIWIEPLLTAEISYNEISSKGTFRAPVFEKMKPDRS